MGKFDGVLLLSDLDGTLTNDKGEITEEVREKLKYFISNGGYFTVCTGRIPHGFHKYDSEIMNAPVVMGNGALGYDYSKNQVVFFNGIGREGIDVVRQIHLKFPDVSIEIFSPDSTCMINMSETSYNHVYNQNISFREIENPEEADWPCIKIMIESTEKSLEVQEFLKGIDCVDYIPTTGNYVEIQGIDVNKAYGVKSLAEYLDIKEENTYTVGDGDNDTAMLSAFYGFVPENGTVLAKEAGNCSVRTNNEGAVANVIEILDEKY